ncbi:MAG: single-stranded-DNA-specific exonuclease RecJ, partial [Pseudomonadota bacterium]
MSAMLEPHHSDKSVRSEQDADCVSFAEKDLETASGSAWHLRAENDVSSEAIEQAIGGPSLLAQVLAGRGIRADNAHAFLNPSLKTDLPDPLILKDMDRAIDRLASAVHAGETIGVFGDYDVDGTTSSAILRKYFDWVGVRSHVRLPDRQLDGYGPNLSAFEFLKGEGASIVITVDCGANAPEVVAAGKNLGLDIIVVDHHQMEGSGPEAADAIVNPCREDDVSGLNGFSASGLVFLLVVGLNRKLRQDGYFADRDEPDLKGLLDLAALGLVCDVMPLTGAVRTIVAQGLKVLSARKDGPGNRGLLALCDAAGAKTPYSGYTFGFQLGPRINAAGRISHADLAFELLTTDDDLRRESLADQLHSINAERQAIEANVQAEAVAIVNRDRLSDDAPIVVAADGWHPGVLGIVAGRLKEKYGRPCVVIGIDEDGTGKGSGRSVSGVDLGKAIRDCYTNGILVAGGGHAMAAGLTISATNIDQFREVL